MSKGHYVCQTCQSDDVQIENWNRWDIPTQTWVYASEGGDEWWCEKCHAHTKDVEWEELP